MEANGELARLLQQLELLKRIQERDRRKQYIHENYTQTESNQHVEQLRETIKTREKEIEAIEKHIKEIQTA
jgi:septal ring factor EnvC (AmiA/AmiB activator)